MRHFLLLSVYALFSTSLLAQQPEKITGVTINPDNSVTFRYRNPKAVTVEVSGEFMQGSARSRRSTAYGPIPRLRSLPRCISTA